MKVKVAQSCLTLCNSMDYTVEGVLKARVLKLVAFSLLQRILPAQESNQGLLHCRWIFLPTKLSRKPLKICVWGIIPENICVRHSWWGLPSSQNAVSCLKSLGMGVLEIDGVTVRCRVTDDTPAQDRPFHATHP